MFVSEKENRKLGTVPASVIGGTNILGFSKSLMISRGPRSVAPAPSGLIGSGTSSYITLKFIGLLIHHTLLIHRLEIKNNSTGIYEDVHRVMSFVVCAP